MLEDSPIVDEISKELAKADFTVDRKKLIKSMNFEITDTSLFINRIKRLVFLLTETEGDYTTKREAYALLSNIYDEKVLNCLADNKKYFDNIKHSMGDYEKITVCLNASLVGASDVAESLFDKKCNPKKNSYIISYALCSGEKEWVKKLVADWKVNLFEDKYCLKFYENKLNDPELSSYYKKSTKHDASFFKKREMPQNFQRDSQKLTEDKCQSSLDFFLHQLENLSEDKQMSYIESALKELMLKREVIQMRKLSPSNKVSVNE